jgi:recombinational DNA repair protein (RecF pathway)
MSIEKITTPSIILSRIDTGESDALLKLYTREFGLIYAKQNSLKKSSKLRGHLLVGRMSNVTLVKGKEYFRITGARELIHTNDYIKHFTPLIERFTGMHMRNPKLFDRIVDYLSLNNQDIGVLKLGLMCDLLIVGGFLNTNSLGLTLEEYKSHKVEDMCLLATLNKQNLTLHIRDAIRESML